MNEIYWITRFDSISIILITFLVFSSVVSVGFLIVYLVNYCNEVEYKDNESKMYKKLAIKFLRFTIPIFFFCCLGKIFIPTTNQAFLIYGVGGTIDYVKSNPTTKQLPDKCVKALDKWVDSWSIEKKDSVKN